MSTSRIWLKQSGVLALGVVLAAAMVVLGLWQLNVYHSQGAATSQRRAAAAPVALTTVAPAAAEVQDGYGRTVTFSGRYDPRLQLLVPVSGGGFRVLTGLRQADDSVVAVVRGTVAAAPAPPPPTGLVDGSGILLPSEEVADPGTAALPPGQVPVIRLPTLAQTWPGPFVNGFVTLGAADARAEGLAPATVDLPEEKGRLRNGAYALQWWVFAAFALGMSIRVARDVGRLEEHETEAYA